ncbi:Hypothetical protein FKW44_003709 [Caligus rogercresseyi]|uniref:Uncharacterized protein n=1 Tax=Caligus rogercresseyi TaxID=217165 RepID=A0A7T8QX83_CALRO|nr:Hypothetical protein FKW44_003709 [Caligus rogercresseyi]
MTQRSYGTLQTQRWKGSGFPPASLTIEKFLRRENREAASAMNQFYIDKVDKLRANIPPVSATLELAEINFAILFLLC